MVLEAITAALVGLAGLLLVVQPLLRRQPSNAPPITEPVDSEETARGVALAALKEIDFDRETGKLSDADYQFLKAKYTAIALEALRAEQASSDTDPVESLITARTRPVADLPADERPHCRTCGPRPEPDALFCSTCGQRLSSGVTEHSATSDRSSEPQSSRAQSLRSG